MSDYSEHLISMAGGDGEASEAIAKYEDLVENGTMRPDDRRDLSLVLAMVREQRAAIDTAKADGWDEGHAHYGKYFSPNFPEFGANPYRATEDAS